jgi:hypothetical protein
MPGSARQLRLRPATVALALGETVELKDDSILRRRPPRLNATIGWRSSGALPM